MAQPTPYNRQYNFTDYQTTNPSSPLPGSQVDAELNAVKLTSDQTRQNLGLIQRDDGKLRNLSVHKDAFDRDALAMIGLDGFNPRGDWTTGTSYQPQDLVNYNNATYACLIAHTAAAAFPTDLNAARWILIANAAIGDVSSAVDYFTGNGTTTAFTLTYNYTSNTGVQVYVNGVLQTPTAGAVTGDYSISGTTLTFVSAPPTPAIAGRKNVVVWGANVTVQANVQAAQAAAASAQAFANSASTSSTNSASSASAAASSSTAAATSATNSAASATLASQWASQTSGIVNSIDYSARAWAVGGTGVTDTPLRGAAKEWAVKTGATVDGTEFSAKYYAQSASSSASAAASSATSASSSAASATSSATSAASSSTASAASASLANDWATKTSGVVAGGEFSAKYHAQAAATSASAASVSAANASTSAAEASSSQTAAATSASNASASAAAAATSATNAASSATAAANSATAAAASAVSVNATNFIGQTGGVTGAAQISVGTTAQRPTPAAGQLRFNTTLGKFEGYSGTAWTSVGGGATGGGNDDVFVENAQVVTTNYTISAGKNAMSAGPITINDGVTVTVPSGQVWTIV